MVGMKKFWNLIGWLLCLTLIAALGGIIVSRLFAAPIYDTKGLPELPRSLGITIPNVDLDYYHDERPILPEQVNMLIGWGVLPSEAEKMNYGDFKLVEEKQLLSPISIGYIRESNPELKDVDLSKWTVKQYREYGKKWREENTMITAQQRKRFEELGVTITDATRIGGSDYYYADFERMIRDLEDPAGYRKVKGYIEQYYLEKLAYISYDPAAEKGGAK